MLSVQQSPAENRSESVLEREIQPVAQTIATLTSLMPSLAPLFELADRSAVNEIEAGDNLVSLEHAQQAAAWCDYLLEREDANGSTMNIFEQAYEQCAATVQQKLQ